MDSQVQSPLYSRLLYAVSQELEREENRERLKSFILQPTVTCIWTQVQPALITSVFLLLVIALANAYLVYYIVYKSRV